MRRVVVWNPVERRWSPTSDFTLLGFADRLGLGDALSTRIPPRGERFPLHDRCKVLVQTALVLAGRRELHGHRALAARGGYLPFGALVSEWISTDESMSKSSIGLLPKTPFLLCSDVSNLRRLLHPIDFVKRLAEVANQDYVGDRLDYEDWERFRRKVRGARDLAVRTGSNSWRYPPC